MKGIVISKDRIIIEVSKNELAVFASALTEICNEIEDWEFETRVGIEKVDVKKFTKSLLDVYIKSDNR